MFGIIALVLLVVLAVIVLSFAVHVLFSPLLLLVAAAIVGWLMFRRSRR